MSKITIDKFKINMEPVTFDNPNDWTEEEILDLFSEIRKTFKAAFNIQCMAVADVIKKSKPND
ncbi:hypothetical protein DRO61_06170 [Candidatus Bathyarchaeota archaeon]|nr:MAG: hypothetical protein DRO61_06170 [Candidatus Bathyarchaeota archaeon]